jgi:hypothetical protein
MAIASQPHDIACLTLEWGGMAKDAERKDD